MEEKKKAGGKLLEWGVPFLLSFALFILPLFFITPLYALNDDLQLRDILSGAASGTPDFHTVYMRAPLAMLLAGLYSILPSLPWLGILECGTILLCSFFLLRTIFSHGDGPFVMFIRLLFFAALYLLFLRGLYMLPHYTVVAALCGGTGIWFLVSQDGHFQPWGRFSAMGTAFSAMGTVLLSCFKEHDKRTVPVAEKAVPVAERTVPMACSLLLLCDQIRSQVFMMVLPFAALALLYRLLLRYGWKERKKWKSCLRPIFLFFVCFVLLFLIHTLAYSAQPWKDYLALNKARTELYDYTGVWESEAAREYYATLGVTPDSFPLYRDYDLLPLRDADTEQFHALAAWQEPGRSLQGVARVKNAIRELIRRIFPFSGGADLCAIPLFVLYLLVILKHWKKERRAALIPIAGAFLLHFLFYSYLLWNGRVPERVTDSLYLIQFLLLSALLLRELSTGRALIIPALACITVFIPVFFTHPGEDYGKQSAVNQRQDVVYSYMAERPDSLFLLETYATVDRTENVALAKGAENALLLGGWLYGSPLQEKKLAAFGYGSREELFEKGGAYVIFRKDAGLSAEELMPYVSNGYPGGAHLEARDMLTTEKEIYLIFQLVK